jgi:hypothetical protein
MRQRFLYQEFNLTTTAAQDINSTTITIPKQHGRLVGFYFTTDNATLADQADCRITVSINGDDVMVDGRLLRWGSNYNQELKMIEADDPGGGVMKVTLANDSANDVTIEIGIKMDLWAEDPQVIYNRMRGRG